MSTADALFRDLVTLRAAVAGARPVGGALPLPMDRLGSASLRNLAHFEALRSCLPTDLSTRLAAHGLADLGTATPHVLATIDVLVARIAPSSAGGPATGTLPPIKPDEARRLATERAEALFGSGIDGEPRIMATAPVGACDEETALEALLNAGLDILRINGATANSEELLHTCDALVRAQERTGRACRVLIDLNGRKVRTGSLPPAPGVIHLRPRRDLFGRVVERARVWLVDAETNVPPPREVDAVIGVPGPWLARLAAGTLIDFEDTRGARRQLAILGAWPEGALCATDQSAYLANGSQFHLRGWAGEDLDAWCAVAGLAEAEGSLSLSPGDLLVLTGGEEPGQPPVRDALGNVVRPARIACLPATALAGVQRGHRVLLDDGKLMGVVEELVEDGVEVRITRARGTEVSLRGGRGIALPDSEMTLPALSPLDEALLPIIATRATLVGMSFVESAEDIFTLRRRLAGMGAPDIGIILKIETPSAVERLPQLIAAAISGGPFGLLIARGDLAQMAGYEQLPQLQRRISDTARAAHVPVVWASQVLDQLTRRGVPTRAEMTDLEAALGADCIMLNKGPFVVEALEAVRASRRMADQEGNIAALQPARASR